MIMSNFFKGLGITSMSIAGLMAMTYGILWFLDPYVSVHFQWNVLLGAPIVYCVAGMVLSLIFFAIRGKRTLATGMLAGTVIGILLFIILVWSLPT